MTKFMNEANIKNGSEAFTHALARSNRKKGTYVQKQEEIKKTENVDPKYLKVVVKHNAVYLPISQDDVLPVKLENEKYRL